jgi:SET domain-containing protein
VGHMVASWISAKARKGISGGIAGRGLFASEQIDTGEIVAVKGGHIVTTTQLRQLPDPLPNSEIQIADGLHLVAVLPDEYEPVMLYINHSCEPNVGFAGNVVLITMREVTAGEELTTDYALFDDYAGQMTCLCNTASCRRVIDGHDWRRSDLQQRYHGYFSWYLQRKITEMHARSDRA